MRLGPTPARGPELGEPRHAGRARALALIAAALLGCNLAAWAGIALVDARLSTGRAEHNPVVAAAIAFFQPQATRITDPDLPRAPLVRAWVQWDSEWYASIAKDGYWYVPGEQSPVAFFPAYPMSIRAFHALGLNRFVVGILLAAVLGCGGLFLFNRWAAHLHGEERALSATALFVGYPFAFYLFGAMYSDALFLCAAVGAFYALERNRLLAAVLLGAVATAARPIGPAIVLGLVARRLELRSSAGEQIGASDLVPALAGAGLAAYALFLWQRFGDLLAFVHVQSAPGWDHLAGASSYLKLPFWEMLAGAPTGSGALLRLLNAALAIMAFACAIPMWRRWSRGYAVYVAVAVGMPLISSKDFMGLGRYAMAAFPSFVMLSQLLEPRPGLRRVLMVASWVGLALLTIAFAAGQFVA